MMKVAAALLAAICAAAALAEVLVRNDVLSYGSFISMAVVAGGLAAFALMLVAVQLRIMQNAKRGNG